MVLLPAVSWPWVPVGKLAGARVDGVPEEDHAGLIERHQVLRIAVPRDADRLHGARLRTDGLEATLLLERHEVAEACIGLVAERGGCLGLGFQPGLEGAGAVEDEGLFRVARRGRSLGFSGLGGRALFQGGHGLAQRVVLQVRRRDARRVLGGARVGLDGQALEGRRRVRFVLEEERDLLRAFRARLYDVQIELEKVPIQTDS